MRETIPTRDGLYLLLAAIAGDESPTSLIEIRPLRPEGRQQFFPVRDLWDAVDAVAALREHHDLVAFGAAPRVRPSGRASAVERVWALRADLDSPESVARLRAFRPLPSVVARSKTPSRLHAYWQLRRPLSPEWARRSIERLAGALGSDPAIADAARVMRAPVEFVRCELSSFEAAEVVSGLRDRVLKKATPAGRGGPLGSPVAALEGLAAFVRASEEGSRNVRLNWASHRAGQRVAAGELDESHAHGWLLAAALDVGLPEGEALTTIESGMQAGARG